MTTFFNQTITIVEKSVLVDTEQIFMWIIIAVLLALPGMPFSLSSCLLLFKRACPLSPEPLHRSCRLWDSPVVPVLGSWPL